MLHKIAEEIQALKRKIYEVLYQEGGDVEPENHVLCGLNVAIEIQSFFMRWPIKDARKTKSRGYGIQKVFGRRSKRKWRVLS